MNPNPTAHQFAASVNWLAYADSLKSEHILAGISKCASDLAEDGILSVELPIAHVDSEIEELGTDFWSQIRSSFDKNQISIASVHGPVFSFDRFSLEQEISRLKLYAAASVALGAGALVVHPVLHANLHVCTVARLALDRDIALASTLCEAFEGTCCRLAIENVPHNSWAYLRELFKNLPSSAGMCFDTGHYQVRPECSIPRAMDDFGDRIACWHLNDNDGLCDAHLIPGRGCFDWNLWKDVADHIQAPRVIELSHPPRWENPDSRTITRRSITIAMAETKELLGR